ncbi:hypothetical protein Sango_0642500 [Sesamum angolense]|uniref:CCHC-type domain-containing protein n=1 Tax=Sesamum angolense TaxID=2727404 RepID=A0AAE1X6U1_9LAMI|nr:hypothetical protein Sango_0642500 [Sesamum angolense]
MKVVYAILDRHTRKRKKDKTKAKVVLTVKDAKSAPIAPVGIGKEKRKMGTLQQSRANNICTHCHEKGHWKRDCHKLPPKIKRSEESKSLEIDNLDNLPSLNIYGPLNTQGRGGFSYFIIFTDDHSQYGYVYLMRYKSEAFVRFKEFRLEVKNQTGHKIKTLQLDRGGEYLSGTSEAPQSNAGTSSVPTVSTDNVLILHRSARVPQPLERPDLWQKDILSDLESILRNLFTHSHGQVHTDFAFRSSVRLCTMRMHHIQRGDVVFGRGWCYHGLRGLASKFVWSWLTSAKPPRSRQCASSRAWSRSFASISSLLSVIPSSSSFLIKDRERATWFAPSSPETSQLATWTTTCNSIYAPLHELFFVVALYEPHEFVLKRHLVREKSWVYKPFKLLVCNQYGKFAYVISPPNEGGLGGAHNIVLTDSAMLMSSKNKIEKFVL